MNDQRRIERLIVHLRAHVIELRRVQDDGGTPRELEERTRAVGQLRSHLAYAVREVVETDPTDTEGEGNRAA